MSQRAMLKQLLEPSLGKVGISGIALCLALLAYAPPAPDPATTELAAHTGQAPVAAQSKAEPSPRG